MLLVTLQKRCSIWGVNNSVTKIEYEKVMRAEDHTVAKKQLTDEQKNILKDAMQKKIDEAKTVKADEI